MCTMLVNCVLLELAEGRVWEQGGLCFLPNPLFCVRLASWICTSMPFSSCLGCWASCMWPQVVLEQIEGTEGN